MRPRAPETGRALMATHGIPNRRRPRQGRRLVLAGTAAVMVAIHAPTLVPTRWSWRITRMASHRELGCSPALTRLRNATNAALDGASV